MMMLGQSILLAFSFFALSLSQSAQAASCLPDFISLNEQFVILEDSGQREWSLRSSNSQGLFYTEVYLKAHVSDGLLTVKARFSDEKFPFSNPYSLFAILILIDGQPFSWQDFTAECEAPGIGFYPSQSATLLKKPLPKNFQGRFKILVWGRL